MATQWLTDEERTAWLALTGMLTTLPTALDAQLGRDADLTFFEYMALAMLSEEPEGTLRMSVLADRTSGSLSRLSHVARRLEKRGLLVREGAPEDRRATNAVLTDAGRRAVQDAADAHVRFVREIVIDGISSDDLATFARVSNGILARLAAAD